MKRKYQGTLKVKPMYPLFLKRLVGLIGITQGKYAIPDYRFKMKSSIWKNDICLFTDEEGPALHFWIKEILYEEKS